jgi:hypothetical protein
MGQFQDYLQKILQVEAEGFNPTTETYAARIGKLEDGQLTTVTTTPDGTTVTQAATIDGDPRQDISQAFINRGFEDPFLNLTPGAIDQSRISTPFNIAAQDTTIADPRQVIDAFNRFYLPTEEQVSITPEGTLEFKKPEARQDTDPIYKFEKSPSQSQEKDAGYVYTRWDEKTGKHITYDTEQAYLDAIKEYETTTGRSARTGKPIGQ